MIYASEDMCKSELGKRLQYWRCERPSEWIMDEFISGVEKLSEENAQLKARVADLEHRLTPWMHMQEFKEKLMCESNLDVRVINLLANHFKNNEAVVDYIRKELKLRAIDGIGRKVEQQILDDYADKLERDEL